MKYAVLLGDGMTDYPVDELGGKTPLEYARTPNMDRMAAEGTLGLVDTIPKGFTPGSDVANLSVLGYNPELYYTGRGPLEAASMDVRLGLNDVAFRCNLVHLGADYEVMDSFNADHISSEEAKELIAALNDAIGSESVRFYPGVGYRHLMVWSGGSVLIETTPPHDIVGQGIETHLPRGVGSESVRTLMERSRDTLKDHPVNHERTRNGKRTANSIWLWGQGRAPEMDPMTKKYSIKGGMISAVDLLNGIGVYAGLDIISVPGATGYIDTNYLGKAEKALTFLEGNDFVFIHVEAPDEMGHEGNIEGKVRAIEDFDAKIVGTVLNGMTAFEDYRVIVLSDHPTPIIVKTHTSDPGPFAVYSSRSGENMATGLLFNEKAARQSGIIIAPGHILMDTFIVKWAKFIEKQGI
ncbi:MAG: cofactor-independent phosphoglycerate mutase [Deltaproteobacteria bacterium]|nr:cofactor-independent phosphoglycerate mutase [Deltaproteobacteria bacterium]MBN2687592.1 cofactor-independent phosphoglycerate mutase [Deltaproteobacteria bacterium]